MHYHKRISWQFLAILICIAAFTFCGMAVADVAITDTGALLPPNGESDAALFEGISSLLGALLPYLSASGQQIASGTLLVMAIIPHIAPWTPWTWDDRTIRYKSGVVQLLAKSWNLLSGNYRRAKNQNPSDF